MNLYNPLMVKGVQMTDSIQEDLALRPVTMTDVEAIVELRNAQMEALLSLREATVQQTRSDWTMPDFNLEGSARALVNSDGRLVGSVTVWDNSPVPVAAWVELDIHPNYNDTDAGQQLLDWAEKRAQETVARAPANARVVLRCGMLSEDTPRQRLLEANNMAHTRSFYTMRIDMDTAPPAPQWPDGIRVKVFNRDSDEIATIKAAEDAFKDHWGFVEEPLEETLKQWQHWMDTNENYDPSLWFLAMAGDEIAGMSLCAPKNSENPDAGYVEELGVRRPWRRKGLATALLHHTFGEFWQRGQQAVTLGVDASSLTGATKLYEKVGMRVQREWQNYEKELRPGDDLSTQTLAE